MGHGDPCLGAGEGGSSVPPMGMLPGSQASVWTERGLYPLPRLCEPPPCFARGGHRRRRYQQRLGRVKECNRILARMETLHGGRLVENVGEQPAPARTDCGRSVRTDAATQVWEAVCRNAPPLSPMEGVDELDNIAEESEFSACPNRCDIVSKEECFSEWMSLPEGSVGSFEVLPELSPPRRRQYMTVKNILAPSAEGEAAAAKVKSYMGMHQREYCLLVGRMLRIGMAKLRRKVKVVNGIFGVWKVRPERSKGRRPGGEAKAEVSPPSGGVSPRPLGAPPLDCMFGLERSG